MTRTLRLEVRPPTWRRSVCRRSGARARIEWAVLVDEVDGEQQLAVGEDLVGRSLGDDAVVLGEARRSGRRARRGSSRSCVASTIVLPARLSSTISSISHCWVRGSSAAVGSSNSSTSGFITSTDAIATRFFWPPDSWYGRAVGEVGRCRACASVSSTRASTCVARQAHVQRTERDLLADRRREHLGVGVLEDEADAGAEAAVELLVLEVVLGDRRRRTRVRAGVGEHEAVEHLQQRRLAAAVGAEQRDLLARARP